MAEKTILLVKGEHTIRCNESDVDRHLAAGCEYATKNKGASEINASLTDGNAPSVTGNAPPNDEEQKIEDAVRSIVEGGDPTHLLGNGSPKVDVIANMVGFPVTADQRDVAFAKI